MPVRKAKKDAVSPFAFLKDKWFVLAIVTAVASVYVFGLREQIAVSSCHSNAEHRARTKMVERARLAPENMQLKQAASSGLYANEDYMPLYKGCLLRAGFESER